jgi:transcriptional regulator with XRE-family HTH domain
VRRIENEGALLMAALGLRLHEAMRTAGLSAEALAITSGVEPDVVEALAAGDGDPRTDLATILRLGEALDIEGGTLIEGVTWDPPVDGRRGRYVVVDPGGMPAIDQKAIDASMPMHLDRKYEIATITRISGALKARPRDLLRGLEDLTETDRELSTGGRVTTYLLAAAAISAAVLSRNLFCILVAVIATGLLILVEVATLLVKAVTRRSRPGG